MPILQHSDHIPTLVLSGLPQIDRISDIGILMGYILGN